MKHPTLDEIRKNFSADTARLNQDVLPGVGRVDPGKHSQPARALDSQKPPKRRRKARLAAHHECTITFTAYTLFRLDPDNLATSFKPLQDAVADWLGIDDGDPRVRWEYGQVETRAQRGVSVIFNLP